MSVTITFYGLESDMATNVFRYMLKDIPTALYDDYGDYFILYQVRYIRSTPHDNFIVFDGDYSIHFESKDYDIGL